MHQDLDGLANKTNKKVIICLRILVHFLLLEAVGLKFRV